MSYQRHADAAKTWLFVVPWDLRHSGGVNQVVINLYKECAQQGKYRPLVLVLDWNARSPVYAKDSGCRTVHLRVKQPDVSMKGLLAWVLALGPGLLQLRRLLRQENVHVINVHYPGTSAVAFALLRQCGLFRGKLLFSFHGMDLRQAVSARGLGVAIWRYLAASLDAASACSEALAAEVRDFFEDKKEKVRVVYGGIDVSSLRAALADVSGADDNEPRQYFINVATYETKKGQDVLIRAFARLARDFPKPDLVLVGRDGGIKGELVSLASELVPDRVQFLDSLPNRDVLILCRRALALILPSRSEPFGLVILEAGALGVPVIASRVGGIPEIIVSEEYGTLVDPDNVEQLEVAMRKMLADLSEGKKQADALRLRVASSFSWTVAFKLLDSMIQT
jgi:glycosyltransferase involved in cell wall biosynthesis